MPAALSESVLTLGSPPNGPPGLRFSSSRLPKLTNTSLTFSLKPGELLTSSHTEATAAEDTCLRECIQVCQGDHAGLHATHRETCHSTMRLIGKRSIVSIDKRDQFIDENFFKLFGKIEIPETAPARLIRDCARCPEHRVGDHPYLACRHRDLREN